MIEQRWQELQDLLDAAWALPPADRPSYLDSHCGDPHLRRELDELLAADQHAEAFFERLAGDVSLLTEAAPEPVDLSGRRVGSYRLVEPLGRGGMGVVYLAERADGEFRQQVAVKLLAMGLAGADGRQRFLAERQMLATLEHPAIARLLHGGVTEDGTPYFVMERVEGQRIDTWCDTGGLGVGERVRLLCRVGDAVEYAHRRLIVHRDLKPANVLVTAEGMPKLLDFGVAKLLDDAEVDLTRSHAPLTPLWAAPEQLEGGTVTTATDTYALGALGYLLLAGAPPHDTGGRAPAMLLHRLQATPPAPSRRFASLPAAEQSRIAAARATSPPDLTRRLTGDLDAILIRALDPDPERRYGSAGDLVADLELHLRGRPVVARPPNLRYRAGKFVRRHTLQVVAASAVVLALVIGAGFATIGLVRARAAEREATAEAEMATQVTDFLVELFDVSDPSEARGRTITARELLQRGSERVDELAEQPLVLGRLKHTLGRVHMNLGLYEDAASLLNASIPALRRAERPTAGAELAAALHSLGVLYDTQGRYAEAERVFRENLRLAETAAPIDEESLGQALNSLAIVRWNRGDYAEAGSLFERALELRERRYGADSLEVSKTLNNLGTLAFSQGELGAAEARYVRALAIERRQAGFDHPDLAGTLNNLGTVYQQQERFEEARRTFEEALDIWEQVLGKDHADVGIAVHNLGDLARAEGDIPRALSFYDRSRRIFLHSFGVDHPYVATSFQAEAAARRALGEPDAAETLYQRSIEIWERAVGPANPALSESLEGLASLLQETGRPAEAESLRGRQAKIASAEE